MERSETGDDSRHVIDITRDTASQPFLSTTNGTNPRNTPFAINSVYLIIFELFMRMSQIIAVIVVMSMSKHEHPSLPLFTWVIGYACGCVATLPLLFWGLYNPDDSTRYNTTHSAMPERLQVLEMLLNRFFIVWIGFSVVLVFAGESSVSKAPNLFRLIPDLLICNAIPLGIRLCLLCINSVLGLREYNHGNNSGPHEYTTEDAVVAA